MAPPPELRARAGCVDWSDPALAALAGDERSAGALAAGVWSADPARTLRRAAGRETFVWPEGGELVVKRYPAGADPHERWRALLAGRRPRSAGRREFDGLVGLAAAGVAVPRALAWVEEPAPLAGGRSAVVMGRVDHAGSLRELAARLPAAARRPLARRVAGLVARLHAAGWHHRDLYLHHLVLPRGGEEPVLLDVARARRARTAAGPRRRWLVKDLAALSSSTPPAVTRAERLRVLVGYLRGRGLDGRAARRRWARAVEAKARRIAAHVPRHLDPADPWDRAWGRSA